MSALAVLIHARAALADPAAWTKGAAGRDRKGAEVEALDPVARCRCAAGWLEHVSSERRVPEAYVEALDALEAEVPDGWDGLFAYNDDPHVPHAAVLMLFDAAIAGEEARGRIAA